MATARALSAALLLAICFAACAYALAAERMPKNRCGKGPAPTKGDYVSHAALPTDKHPAVEKAGAKKMGAPGSKSPYIYISHAAMYRD
ncbi:hypothetical protein U9M48_017010 [Paspalum notatum var. saurae]|uniref:Uncharacterized protein n=1 Tax=Paspalum notatum var. saurae TaxID=547442 RepID=A0AAQ3T6V0_PASNO